VQPSLASKACLANCLPLVRSNSPAQPINQRFPHSQEDVMENQLEHYVEQLCSTPIPEHYSCDINSSSVRSVKAPIPAALNRELQALGAVFGRDPMCLAGDLLGIAIQETVAHLPAHLRARLDETKSNAEQARQAALRDLDWCETGGT